MDREVYDWMREVERDHWWFAARREILADQISRQGLPAQARILEAGCGNGANLEMLSRFGKVSAIEPDEHARVFASRDGVEVKGGFLPDRLPVFDTAFDLVAAFDVLEHVDDDTGSVAALCGLLKPGGMFIATVPAGPWMWSQHDEINHHKRRYRMAGFRKLFEDAGMKVTKATHFNTLLYPPVAAVRVLKNLTGAKEGDLGAVPSQAANALLRTVFAMEKPLLRGLDLPFGVSILLTAQKPASVDTARVAA